MLKSFPLLLFLLLSVSDCLAQEPGNSVVADASSADKIVFKNGTVFQGQIVQGAKTLIDDPNRYEIILSTGQTLSIEDTGQIESVVMDGQRLDDPLRRGGRGKLIEMLEAYQSKTSARSEDEKRKALSAQVDWLVGDVARVEKGSAEPAPLTSGGRVFSGDEVRLSPAARARFLVAGRLRLGLEEGSNLQIRDLQSDPASGRLGFEFELLSGVAWLESVSTQQAEGRVEVRAEGLRVQVAEGLFRVEQSGDASIVLSHFHGPEVIVERVSDGQQINFPSDTRFTFSSEILVGKGPFNPARERITDTNSWLEFTTWKPMESNVPVHFTLVGKPKMAPQPPAPILGLSTERFVFQDLQPIAMSAFAPLAQVYRGALQKFIADVGRPPTEEEGLAALRAAPPGVDAWKGPYLSKEIPELDPWTRPLRYSVIQTTSSRLFNLYSVGENGIDEQGLGDDLR